MFQFFKSFYSLILLSVPEGETLIAHVACSPFGDESVSVCVRVYFNYFFFNHEIKTTEFHWLFRHTRSHFIIGILLIHNTILQS
jgi:hypothetical protein